MKKIIMFLFSVFSLFSISGCDNKFEKAPQKEEEEFESKVYVESIEIINTVDGDECKVSAEKRVCVKENHQDNEKYFVVKFDPNEKEIDVPFYWKVYPDNATNKEVSIMYDNENPNFTIKENVIYFTNKCTAQITIYSTDGTNKKATITFYVI